MDVARCVELPRVLAAQRKRGLIVIWIAVSASLYQHTELATYQAANDPSQPLDTLSEPEQNRKLVEIGERITRAASVNAVANVFSIVDQFAPQAEAFVKGEVEPQEEVRHGVIAVQQAETIRFESKGEALEMIAAEDLKKLDSQSQQLIRAMRQLGRTSLIAGPSCSPNGSLVIKR